MFLNLRLISKVWINERTLINYIVLESGHGRDGAAAVAELKKKIWDATTRFSFLIENSLLKANWNFFFLAAAEVCLRADGFALFFETYEIWALVFEECLGMEKEREWDDVHCKNIIEGRWMQIKALIACNVSNFLDNKSYHQSIQWARRDSNRR